MLKFVIWDKEMCMGLRRFQNGRLHLKEPD